MNLLNIKNGKIRGALNVNDIKFGYNKDNHLLNWTQPIEDEEFIYTIYIYKVFFSKSFFIKNYFIIFFK